MSLLFLMIYLWWLSEPYTGCDTISKSTELSNLKGLLDTSSNDSIGRKYLFLCFS